MISTLPAPPFSQVYCVRMHICEMDGCEKSAYCKGLCKAHYQRQWRHGTPEGADGSVTYTRTRDGKTQTVTRRVRSNETGWSREPLYKIWAGMKYRCENPKAANYRWYGAKGIKVCADWSRDYLAFRDWALANGYEPGKQIDRKKTHLNYSPGNCRWVTRIKNLQNRSQYLPPELEERLLAAAEERGEPAYALIREAVEDYLDRLGSERGKEVVGRDGC
jgi:hypothetical protein